MVENNPDGHKAFVYEVRSAHPMYDYNTMDTIKNMVNMSKPLLETYAEQVTNDNIKPENANIAMVLGALAGSKGLLKAGGDGIKVLKGEADPDVMYRVFGRRKFPNGYFLKKQRSLAKTQAKRWSVENNHNIDYLDNEKTALKKKAYRLLGDMVSAIDSNAMSIKLGRELQERGIDVIEVPTDRWSVFKTMRPVIVRPME